MKTIAISIEEAALQQIDRLARKRSAKRRNRSQVIRQAVQEYISRLERQEREAREDEIIRKHYKKLNRQAAALIRQQAKL
ncbi:MAG: CopG family ribbon-helix-helix protein [Candidatus Acidiferrales bacterium]